MSTRRTGTLKISNAFALCTAGPQKPRHFSALSRRHDAAKTNESTEAPARSPRNESEEEEEDSAMKRRLSEMTEQAILEGGRSARTNLQQGGFSEALKKQLEERVAAATFKSEHAAAHSIINMPASAGQGTRDIAAAAPWTGTESIHDVTLRMLDSSKKKPMRTPYKIPQPAPVDMRLTPKPKRSPGLRLADAKDRTATYTLSQSIGVSEDEREALRREMSERFTSGARPMPATLQGLASLANERIEDAIARGQFDRIKRGKGVNVHTDYNANSAFIDTTEYFMNKIIQKQEIVPPWIEKQQELAREIDRFRQRLRAEWRRHAARIIASQGGSLEAQMRRAQAYAAAEARLSRRVEIEKGFKDTQTTSSPSTEQDNNDTQHPPPETTELEPEPEPEPQPKPEPKPETQPQTKLPHVSPLRDPQYIATERSFLELSVKSINDLARSYNLQAPPVAQKPYLNLERELAACYADVAPSLAEEIKRRATERARPSSIGSKATSVLDSLTTSQSVRVYEEDRSKGYGFKEFWQDLFSKKKER